MNRTRIAWLQVLAATTLLSALGLAWASHPAEGAAQTVHYKLIRKIRLGGEGFWDYLSIVTLPLAWRLRHAVTAP